MKEFTLEVRGGTFIYFNNQLLGRLEPDLPASNLATFEKFCEQRLNIEKKLQETEAFAESQKSGHDRLCELLYELREVLEGDT